MQRRQQSLRLGLTLLLLSVIVTLTPRSAASQELVEFETWLDLATIYNVSERFRYDGDYGIRGFLSSDVWDIIYLRPSVRYQVQPWLALHGGVGWFHTVFSDAADLHELRPWLGLRAPWPRLGGFIFSHYLRLELRAFSRSDATTWDREWRGRYQLQVVSPDFGIGSAEGFFALSSIEFFKNIDSSLSDLFVNRIRVNVGLGKRVTQALRMELNYLYHKSRAGDTYNFEITSHALRLRLFYTIN